MTLEMRQSLYHLFSAYGEVIQIRMRETQQLRGQAFVVFRTQQQADHALETLNAFAIFGKEMELHYAKNPSDETRQIITLQNQAGHYISQTLTKMISERRKKRKQKADTKRAERREKLIREQEKLLSLQQNNQKILEEELQVQQKFAKEAEKLLKQQEKKKESEPDLIEQENQQPKQQVDTKRKIAQSKLAIQQSEIIQIDNLPTNFSKLMLDELIKNYPGVEKVIETDGTSCRAVISFNSADSAKFAVMGLNRFKVDQSGRQLSVTFVHKV